MKIEISLEEAVSGTITNPARPPEVTSAAHNVRSYVRKSCGFNGRIYLG